MAYAIKSGPLPFSLSAPLGLVDGIYTVNKFGKNPNCDNSVLTDIWDLTTQPIWLAPTAPRIHAVVSSSVNDTNGGSGAQTLMIWGLKDWDTPESLEILTMDGQTPVNTAQTYVIIHRLHVHRHGADFNNEGIIKATAASDNTITAQIVAGLGQTQMAILGIPSTQNFYMSGFYAAVLKTTGATVNVDVFLKGSTQHNADPLKYYSNKHTVSLLADGSSHFGHVFDPYKVFDGPAIVKVQCSATVNDSEVSAGFDGYLVDK